MRPPPLGGSATGRTMPSQLDFEHLIADRFAEELHGFERQADHVPAVIADEVRVSPMHDGLGSRQLEAPNVVTELRSDEQSRLGQGEEVTIHRCSIELRVGEPLGKLGMADGHAQPGELPQNCHALLGDTNALIDQQLL